MDHADGYVPDLVEMEHPLIKAFATLSETRDFAERRQIERQSKKPMVIS